MTIQEHIQNDLKIAMCEKNVAIRDLLRVVIGEFNREGKEVSDTRATTIIKKMRDNAVEFKNSSEVTILELYLPRQMGKKELTKEIESIVSFHKYTSMKDMGSVMGNLKNVLAGRYDGKMASEIVRRVLN